VSDLLFQVRLRLEGPKPSPEAVAVLQDALATGVIALYGDAGAADEAGVWLDDDGPRVVAFEVTEIE
jgi:hypothetical protein